MASLIFTLSQTYPPAANPQNTVLAGIGNYFIETMILTGSIGQTTGPVAGVLQITSSGNLVFQDGFALPTGTTVNFYSKVMPIKLICARGNNLVLAVFFFPAASLTNCGLIVNGYGVILP